MLDQISKLYERLEEPCQINEIHKEISSLIRTRIADLGEPDLWETDCLVRAIFDLARNINRGDSVPTELGLGSCLRMIEQSLTPPENRSPDYPDSRQQKEALSSITAEQLLEALDDLQA